MIKEFEKRIEELEAAQGRELVLARQLLNMIKENKELAESKPAEVEEWPKVGDEWFRVEQNGAIDCVEKWTGSSYANAYKTQNNCYRTREEAEAKSKWLANPRTEARFRLEQLEGFDVMGRYAIIFDIDVGALCVYKYYTSVTGGFCFTTKDHAEHAMTHHAADLMLVLKGEVQS